MKVGLRIRFLYSVFLEYFMNKKEVRKLFSWFFLFILVFLGIVLIFLSNGYFSSEKNEIILTCGDGSYLGECSFNKPLFCTGEGELIERASICGCEKGYRKKGELCVNNYYSGEEVKAFEYFFRGELTSLNLTLYSGVNDYVKDLDRTKFYFDGEFVQRRDFKFLKIEDEIQKEALSELIYKIQNLAPNSKEDQARIAISLVQRIPYSENSEESTFNENDSIKFARFPYQVLYEGGGSCEGKSELLVLLLRELGFGTAFFYYSPENHETVGISCPVEESFLGSGYCFVETTSPSILGDHGGEYLVTGNLFSDPDILVINEGFSLGNKLEEYKDSKKIMSLREGKSIFTFSRSKALERLAQKYGL